jgi:hypothetical protein
MQQSTPATPWARYEPKPPEQIVSEYPHLTLAGIYAALAYYHDHREEVNADIRREREWYEEMHAKHPSRLQGRLTAAPANDQTRERLR